MLNQRLLLLASVIKEKIMAKKVWETPNPKKKSTPLSSAAKASAKAAATRAGRKYPNLVDNMRAARKKAN
jgi:ribosomal protein L15E